MPWRSYKAKNPIRTCMLKNCVIPVLRVSPKGGGGGGGGGYWDALHPSFLLSFDVVIGTH